VPNTYPSGFLWNANRRLIQLLLQAFGAGIDMLGLPGRLPSLGDRRGQCDRQYLAGLTINLHFQRTKVDVLELDAYDLAVTKPKVKRRVEPPSHLAALRADPILLRVPDLAFDDLAAQAR